MVVARLLVCSLLVGGVAGADQTRPASSPARAKPAGARRSKIKYTPAAGESNIGAGAVAAADPAPVATAALAAMVEPPVAADPPPRPLPVDRHRNLRIGLGLASGAVLIGGIVALGVVFSSHSDNGASDWGTLVVTRR